MSAEIPKSRIDHLIAANQYRRQTSTSLQAGRRNSTALDFGAIVNTDNFIRIWKEQLLRPGRGPGVDGFRFEHFSKTEIAAISKVAIREIENGTWRPRETKQVSWPKSSGNGLRRIDIRTTIDRLVSSAVATPLMIALEGVLQPTCFAYRPRKSSLHLLATIKREIEATERTVIAQDDIRDAFPSVNITRTIVDFAREVLPNESDARLLLLIEAILRGNMRSEVGIEQGDPISPLALNTRLHYSLDVPSQETTRPDNLPLRFRYSDNIPYLTRSVTEGERALERDRQILLQTEFRFKGENNYPVDLRRRGSSIELLGFLIRLEEHRIKFDLGRKAINSLSNALASCKLYPAPVLAAEQVLTGWLHEYGAAFESYEPCKYMGPIMDEIKRHRFYEFNSESWIYERMAEAVGTWNSIYASVGDETLMYP